MMQQAARSFSLSRHSQSAACRMMSASASASVSVSVTRRLQQGHHPMSTTTTTTTHKNHRHATVVCSAAGVVVRTMVTDQTMKPSLEEEEEKEEEEREAEVLAQPFQPKNHQRVWYAAEDEEEEDSNNNEDNNTHTSTTPVPQKGQSQKNKKKNDKDDVDADVDDVDDTKNHHEIWHDRVLDSDDFLTKLLGRIEAQEFSGGRMRTRQLGVLHEDPAQDMALLTQNYTLPAVASALRDREDVLQQAAVLADNEDWKGLQQLLHMYHPKYVAEQRLQRRQMTYERGSMDAGALETIRKALMRMPRTVVQSHTARAAVVVALCTVNGIPSLLLEKRAAHLRAHPDEVCLPGGMVCSVSDRTIVETCLREMQEEIEGIDIESTQVLGVFRCNWGEVHHLVGVAVTPVVCFLGELPSNLKPNPSEVSQVFTLPLESLLDKSLWLHKEGLAPIFLGGPHPIWGLTGYILDRFGKDILAPNSISRFKGASGSGSMDTGGSDNDTSESESTSKGGSYMPPTL